MSQHTHAVVWIDHREARVFHFNADEVEKLVIHPDHRHTHIHHKANSMGSGHAAEDHKYLDAVAGAISEAREVLIAGPGGAKTELMKHIAQYEPRQLAAIRAVETVDHPTDGELVAHARKYFRAEDLKTAQKI